MGYIKCGIFRGKNIYLLVVIILKIVKDSFLNGVNYRKSFKELKFPGTITQQYLSKHRYIHQIFCFFGVFIISWFINRIKKGTFKLTFLVKNENEINTKEEGNSKISFLYIILFLTLWVIEEPILAIYKGNFTDLDFWMIELIILAFLMSKHFSEKLYKHQQFAMYINLFISMIKVIIIIISVSDEEVIYSLYLKYPIIIQFLIILYLILISLRSYINVNLRIFFDFQYIDEYEIIIIYGFIGFIINLILCIITTFNECNFKNMEYFCRVPYKDENYKYNSKGLYLDNYKIYYETLKGNVNNTYSEIEIIYEILVVFFGVAVNYIYKFYLILVIKYLSPMHLVFSNCIDNILIKFILPIYTLIREESFFSEKPVKNIKLKYILGLLMNILSLFAFLIYLEIIQLNCCGLDYDTRQNIYLRGVKEEEDGYKLYNDNKNDNNDENDDPTAIN